MPIRSARKRYNKSVLLLSLLYAVGLIGAEVLFNRHAVRGGLAYATAILPAMPIIGIFASLGRYLAEERDEYVRMLMVRQSLIASAFALSAATVWGFLQSFNLTTHVDAYYIAVLWFGGFGLGACVNRFTQGREA